MIKILVDHDIEGHAALLLFGLRQGGWINLNVLEILTFSEVGLDFATADREMWRFAQENKMLLMTGNRNMDGEDSLEHTIRRENIETSSGYYNQSTRPLYRKKLPRYLCD